MAFQATLVQAGVGIRPDGELWGAVVVQPRHGDPKLYAQYIPQYPNVEPPGWAAIADLTGLSAAETLSGWDDDGRTNVIAAEAFARLAQRIGQEFIVREVPGLFDEQAVELIALSLAPDADALALDTAAVTASLSVAQKMGVIGLQLGGAPNGQPLLHFALEDGRLPAIPIPDVDFDPDPDAWFLVETFTSLSAHTIAGGWKVIATGARENTKLNSVLREFMPIVVGRQIPLADDGEPDWDNLRRVLIHERAARKILPRLFIDRSSRLIYARIWTLLQDMLGSRLFRSSVERSQSSGIPAIIRTVEGGHKLETLDSREKVRAVLLHYIDFCNSGKRTISYVEPPWSLSEHMTIFAEQSVRPIDSLVRLPIMRADGTVHDQPGYDARSRIWYAPEMQLEPIPDRPTEGDVRQSLARVLAPFVDFPFEDGSGARAAAVACLFDQLMRPMVAGPRPLFVFDAPAVRGMGTGKSLLAQTIGTLVTGQSLEVTPWPDDPKELPKIITAKLLQGAPFVQFDNVEKAVKHKDLAALATATHWSSRLLHSNDIPRLAQNTTWALTMNGAAFSRDIARRTLTCMLDTHLVDPSKRREFKIPELIPWCLRHRAEVIRACLMLARAWVVAGRPADTKLAAGSFESWQRVVGGVLRFAGVDDLHKALSVSRQREVDTDEYDFFVERWAQHYGTQRVGPLELAAIAEHYTLFAATLEHVRAPNWKGRYMTEILRKLEGQTFGNYRVASLGLNHGTRAFALIDATAATSAPPTLTLVSEA